MASGKGLNPAPRKPVGLDEIDLPSNQTDTPPNYFAGVASLNASWVMTPMITLVKNANGGGKGK